MTAVNRDSKRENDLVHAGVFEIALSIIVLTAIFI
jgi:hypothetical protein